MTNYNEYLKFNEDVYAQKQEKILPKIVIDYDTTDAIKKISKSINLMVYAEPYCPDSRAVVAVLERIRKCNPNCINIEYIPRKGNEYKLNMISEGKIPTVFLVDGIKLTTIISERPEPVKKIIESSDNPEEEIYNFRIGKYNSEIISSIIEVITKE
ncbi:thioredoxin family protein [Caviibacter abscessus]|uniref:thioredoxin family protein n=1 Tax=Caviibacter abscessus TaxID=1766719 RepID=UPI00082AB83B|nr:thioredoxin family protein [Caviibacter abscessus]